MRAPAPQAVCVRRRRPLGLASIEIGPRWLCCRCAGCSPEAYTQNTAVQTLCADMLMRLTGVPVVGGPVHVWGPAHEAGVSTAVEPSTYMPC
jgi:hypothetical protein